MVGSSSELAPEWWEPPTGGAIAEPEVPRLIAMFGLRACWYESFPFDVQLPRIEPGRIVLPADEPGISPWSLDLGIELPVRHCGLTVGRYVLAPASPSTGAGLSSARRAEAMSMAASVGSRIAAAMLAEAEGQTGSRSPFPTDAPGVRSDCNTPAPQTAADGSRGGDASNGTPRPRHAVRLRLRRSTRRKCDLD